MLVLDRNKILEDRMNILVDTNILFEKEENVGWDADLSFFLRLLNQYKKNGPLFTILLDKENVLEKEYRLEIKNASKYASKETPIICFEHVLDTYPYITPYPIDELDYDKKIYSLKNKDFNEEFEICLLFLAKKRNSAIIIPKKENSPKIARIYLNNHDILLCKEITFLTLNQLIFKTNYPLFQHPNSISELKSILKALKPNFKKEKLNHFEFIEAEERENIEYKGVHFDYLSKKQLKKSVEAMCGMLNSCERGWVFIGVKDDGNIFPFTPRFKEDGPIGWNYLCNCIREEINRITPPPYKEGVDSWCIYNDNKDKVVIVNYIKKTGINYIYNGDRLIRDGNRTIIDENWKNQENHGT